ncbi:MAG TPA: hypothetical protein VG407_17310 [Caulobacteraceae bacterium]|jgi:hypothetical protein|nr:hypothetical protein [Caulobacteraceae bacterium]
MAKRTQSIMAVAVIVSVAVLSPASAKPPKSSGPLPASTIRTIYHQVKTIYAEAGMIGLEAISSECLDHAKKSKSVPAFQRCVAFDNVASALDWQYSNLTGSPRDDYFAEGTMGHRWGVTTRDFPQPNDYAHLKIGELSRECDRVMGLPPAWRLPRPQRID